jgi:hypothetical protein
VPNSDRVIDLSVHSDLTIPKTLRIFFKYRRRLLGELSRAAVKALTVYFEAMAGERCVPGIIVAVQTFGDRINFMCTSIFW